MADIVDAATRSRMMSGIRRRDTKIEIAVRKALHARGFRYKVDVRRLPGCPDVVLPRWNAVILVHGCFWHAHDCGLCRIPATRPEFWREKLRANAERDRRNKAELLAAGWRVATIWECTLRGKGAKALTHAIDHIERWIRSDEQTVELRA